MTRTQPCEYGQEGAEALGVVATRKANLLCCVLLNDLHDELLAPLK